MPQFIFSFVLRRTSRFQVEIDLGAPNDPKMTLKHIKKVKKKKKRKKEKEIPHIR